MKRAVITSLGLAGYNGREHSVTPKVVYEFEAEKSEHHNVLPLLIEEFGKEYEIVPLFTQASKKANEEVLKAEGMEDVAEAIFSHPSAVEMEKEELDKDYDLFLKRIDTIVERYDEVILDLSHGWRHVPLLMLVDAILQQIKSAHKIRHVFFAKEIEKNSFYQVVDLRNYLDLSMLMLLLNEFLKNFTILNNVSFKEADFERLKELLRTFSVNILSNSVYGLIKKDGIVDQIVEGLDRLKDRESFAVFEEEIKALKGYFEKFLHIYRDRSKPDYEKHIFMAREFLDRDYYLNAVTFLNEAVALKAMEIVLGLDGELKRIANKNLKKPRNLYYISNDSKNLIMRYKKSFHPNSYTFQDDRVNVRELKKRVAKIEGIKEISKFVRECNELRNDLAHINMSEDLENIPNRIKKSIENFEELFIKDR